MGLREQSTVGCFPELCFLQVSVARCLFGSESNCWVPTWACAAGFDNNNNNQKRIRVKFSHHSGQN